MIFSLTSVEMIDKNYWLCTICSQPSSFGVVGISGQYIKGRRYIIV